MDSYDNLPDYEIKEMGDMSKKFLDLNISSFKEACLYVQDMEYGYNSDKDDPMILFKEKCGSCTTKHGVIATLAEELGIPLYKKVCVYKFTEEITTGVHEILKKYDIPYVPMVHCFLVYEKNQFDLTEGNINGKKKSIDDYIYAEKVEPFISRRDEYRLFRKILKEKVMPSEEMQGISERILLKAREEAIVLLKMAIQK